MSDLHLLFDPRPAGIFRPDQRKFAAARAQDLSRLATFLAATRQGLASIGPSTVARLIKSGRRLAALVGPRILNRWFLGIFTPLLTRSHEQRHTRRFHRSKASVD